MPAADDETITLARSRPAAGVSTTDTLETLVIPRQLGNVRLLTEIGRGGMGVVYTGRDELLNRVVAVKFLSGAVPSVADPGFAEFLEGVRAAAAIQRAGLTTIYQAGVIEGLPYVIMQYVNGPTVSQLIAHNPLSVEDALHVVTEAIELTAALHEQGIVHRDIKPSNLMVDAGGQLFLTDFGLAHRRGNVNEPTTSWSGTPAYMAPEMFEGQVSARSDVYALGITAYEIITGEKPFAGTVDQLRSHHIRTELPTEPLAARKLKTNLIEVLARATHKRSMFRYKTAEDFARALRAALPDSQGTRARAEMSLSVRVDRWRERPTVDVGLSTASAVVIDGTPVPDVEQEGSREERLSALVSMKRTTREAQSLRERIGSSAQQVVVTPAAPAPPPPPPVDEGVHCLRCGYDRRGLERDARCPECGEPELNTAARERCHRAARRPLWVAWRHATFRTMPEGWWEVLGEPSASVPPTNYHRRAWVIVCIAALLSFSTTSVSQLAQDALHGEYEVTRSYYLTGQDTVRITQEDPPVRVRKSVFDKRSPRELVPSKPTPAGMNVIYSSRKVDHFKWPGWASLAKDVISELAGTVFIWISYRYVWLNVLLRRNRTLSAAERAAARVAGDALAPVLLAFMAWGVVMAVAETALVTVRFESDTRLNVLLGLCVAGLVMVILPVMLWSPVRADVSRRVFPNRFTAKAWLGVTTVVTMTVIGALAVSLSYLVENWGK